MTKQHNQEEEREEQDVNVIQIGEIAITSTKNSLKNCIGEATKLLKNSDVKDYLSINLPKKRVMGL